jgi:peptidyl-prolyl cis-trans isomerase A (cyclophilin A)
MKTFLYLILCGALSVCMSATQAAPKIAKTPNPQVLLKTNQGNITIELFAKAAPITVKNFLQYVDQGFYNNVIFHRVIPGFVIQGGGFDKQYQSKITQPPIINGTHHGP